MIVITRALDHNDADGTSRIRLPPVTPNGGAKVMMLDQLSTSVRRRIGILANGRTEPSSAPLVRLGDGSEQPVVVAQTDIGMLRGVTDAAADTAECTCPEPCERDHANE